MQFSFGGESACPFGTLAIGELLLSGGLVVAHVAVSASGYASVSAVGSDTADQREADGVREVVFEAGLKHAVSIAQSFYIRPFIAAFTGSFCRFLHAICNAVLIYISTLSGRLLSQVWFRRGSLVSARHHGKHATALPTGL